LAAKIPILVPDNDICKAGHIFRLITTALLNIKLRRDGFGSLPWNRAIINRARALRSQNAIPPCDGRAGLLPGATCMSQTFQCENNVECLTHQKYTSSAGCMMDARIDAISHRHAMSLEEEALTWDGRKCFIITATRQASVDIRDRGTRGAHEVCQLGILN
jgi:hypothetical protein